MHEITEYDPNPVAVVPENHRDLSGLGMHAIAADVAIQGQGDVVLLAPDSPELVEQETKVLANDLLRDFYQTFRLAQGEPAIQPPLFVLLADAYASTGKPAYMGAALELAGTNITKLMPPKQHLDTIQKEREHPETGFLATWIDYKEALIGEDTGSTRSALDLLDDMAYREIEYQIRPRPQREGADAHESIMREYILGGSMKASPRLLGVRDLLRQIILEHGNVSTRWSPHSDNTGLRLKLVELSSKWEENHPGQKFFTQ